MTEFHHDLTYSTFTQDAVDVVPAFCEVSNFFLGRFAATSELLPPTKAAGGVRVMMGASAGLDPREIRLKAFAEFVERVSPSLAGHEPGRIIDRTLVELKEEKAQFLHPSSLLHFAKWQKVEPLLVSLSPHDSLGWCKGYDLCTQEEILVPALIAFLRCSRCNNDPQFLVSTSCGLAAHADRISAICHAVLEIIERDALMLSWRVPNWPVAHIRASLVPEDLIEVYRALGLELELYSIGFPDNPQTVLAVLYGPNYTALTCGAACGNINLSTISKAICEALMLQWTMRYSTPVKKWLLSHSPHQMIPKSTLEYLVYTFYHGESVVEWYHKQCTYPDISTYTSNVPDNFPQFVEMVKNSIGKIIVVNVTDYHALHGGWHVYRAIIPNAHPRDTDHRIAHLGGLRLEEGRKLANSAHLPLHTTPHPIA